MKDSFWEKVEKNRTKVDLSFELSYSSSKVIFKAEYKVLFKDHKEGEKIHQGSFYG